MNCEVEKKLELLKMEVVALKEQNAIQAIQINWCAEMIFALVEVINK